MKDLNLKKIAPVVLVLIGVVYLLSTPRSVSQRDIDLAVAICEPLGGLHSIVLGSMGMEAVTCKQRTDYKYTCLDRIVSEKDLREVDSLTSCFFSNDASPEEIEAAIKNEDSLTQAQE